MISDDYIVLAEYNIDRVAELTGKTKHELEEMLKESTNFDRAKIFWKVYDRWFEFTANSRHVIFGQVDSVVQEIIRQAIGD